MNYSFSRAQQKGRKTGLRRCLEMPLFIYFTRHLREQQLIETLEPTED
jgi:hypothetical protein